MTWVVDLESAVLNFQKRVNMDLLYDEVQYEDVWFKFSAVKVIVMITLACAVAFKLFSRGRGVIGDREL